MAVETIARFAEPLILVATLLLGVVIGITLEKMRADRARRAWRERNGWHQERRRPQATIASPPLAPTADTLAPIKPDAADQLRIVMAAEFSMQPLLNRSEARVFKELDRMVLDRNPGWQVMAKVALGEILRCKDPAAYGCINSKRVDLLLVDENCHPRHAVEYQGGGHHQGAAAARDAVKKEALRRAGIPYHEVVAGRTTPSELRRLIETLVDVPIAEIPETAPGD